MRHVSIPSYNKQTFLTGTLITPEKHQGKNKAILFIHGWRSSEKGYIHRGIALAKHGFICLSFNLSSHGTSPGDIETITRQNFLDDVVSAYDFLKQQDFVDSNHIGVIGASFGGYLAALLTKERLVRQLVMRAPANYPDDGFSDTAHILLAEVFEKKLWREKKLEYHQTRSLKAVHDFVHEILLVESENDTIVPHQTVQNYGDAVRDKQQLTYKIMKGADHHLGNEKQQQEFITILEEWFTKHH